MNRDLFLAILSMDSYNRGYGAGVNLPGGQTRIGSATILPDSEQRPEIVGGQAAGFYAVAYDVSGAGIDGLTGTVIAFRGTDGVLADVENGWSIGGGIQNDQSNLMIDFYQAVARGQGVTSDWRTANITTTGHSLGGGLAGLAANDNAFCENLGARSRAA